MQAIITKFLGPTDTKGSRIKAFADAGSVTIGYPHELSGEDAFRAAAVALCEKLEKQACANWRKLAEESGRTYSGDGAPTWDASRLIGGYSEKIGYVFVFGPAPEK